MDKSPIQLHNANQVVQCNGSVMMQIQNPPSDTGDDSHNQAKLEGRAFHQVAEMILKSFIEPNGDLASDVHVVGTMSKDNIVITSEIYDAARDFANDVLKFCNGTGTLRKMNIEQKIDTSHLFPGSYGFGDVWVYDEVNNHLVVWEGKFGHGIVEVFEDYQLLSYVSGILEKLGIDGHQELSLKVTMKVVQPRGFHIDGPIRSWSEIAGNLRCYFNILKAAFNDAYVDPKCKANPYCKKCHARYACNANQQAAMNAMDYIGEVFDNSLSGNNLAFELRLLKRAKDAIDNRYTGLVAQATSEIRSGDSVPGFGLKQGYGNKRWKRDVPVDQVIMMGDMMGEDLRKPAQLLTPTQIINKGVDESVINMYSETPMTSLKLVDDSKSAKARQTFRKD